MSSDQQQDEYELNLRVAQSAHERFYSDAAQLFQSVLSFADIALKGSAILNGGAAVAVLAFIGALLASQSSQLATYGPLVGILSTFGIGVLFSTLAGGASYLAQMAYYYAHSTHELTWKHPYVFETPKVRSRNAVGVGFHVAAILLVALSYGSFGLGGWQFHDFAAEVFGTAQTPAETMDAAPVAEGDGFSERVSAMAPDTVNVILATSAIAATAIGPIAAVLITLGWERLRRSREERQLILQTLLATRGRPADPGFSWAIRTAPLHYARDREVLSAHASYMDAVRLQPTAENREKADSEIGRRLGILISEMLKALGYRGLSAEQIEAYTAQGLVDREELMVHALQSLPHIAMSAKRSADAAEAMLARMPKLGDES